MRHKALAANRNMEAMMNEDVFNVSIRKFLKTRGVSARREIEKAVRQVPWWAARLQQAERRLLLPPRQTKSAVWMR